MKIFRKLAFSAFFLFAASPVSAQLSLSVLGGANLASMDVSSDDTFIPEMENVQRISLGVAADIPLSERFGIEFGGAYSQKGSGTQFSEDGATAESLLEVDYLEFTAFGRLAVPLAGNRISAHLLAGPALAFETSCDRTLSAMSDGTSISTTESCGEDLNRPSYDFGLAGGGGLDIGLTEALGLNFGVLYNYGLKDLDEADASSVRHRVVTLRAGLSYLIG